MAGVATKFTHSIWALICTLAISGGLVACNAPGAVPGTINQSFVTTTPPLGTSAAPTTSGSGPAPPAFDRYGNANYDSSGAYIGGHGIGTTVDNPDQSNFGAPNIPTPDISSMHCTGSTGANAGTLNCSN